VKKLIENLLIIGFLICIVGLNHIAHGNSNRKMSIYEVGKRQVILYQRKTESDKLAKYMYERIKEYQKYDGWYERTYMFLYNWEQLQKEK